MKKQNLCGNPLFYVFKKKFWVGFRISFVVINRENSTMCTIWHGNAFSVSLKSEVKKVTAVFLF